MACVSGEEKIYVGFPTVYNSYHVLLLHEVREEKVTISESV